jgi:TRAP-type uncharacterized transport system fused permease subunit
MGMPTVGVYIMGVALLAPVFIGKFGLPLMDVHMFILFFSCMSSITPPVAVAAFAAGSIAGANPFKLAPYACKLAVGGFVLPFFFIFNNGILLQKTWGPILSDVVVAAGLVLTSVLVLHGYVGRTQIPWWVRLAMAVAALAMGLPHLPVQYAALAVAAALFLWMWRSGAAATVAAS